MCYLTWQLKGKRTFLSKKIALQKMPQTIACSGKSGRSVCWWGIAEDEAEKTDLIQKLSGLFMTCVHVCSSTFPLLGSQQKWNSMDEPTLWKDSSESSMEEGSKGKVSGNKESVLEGCDNWWHYGAGTIDKTWKGLKIITYRKNMSFMETHENNRKKSIKRKVQSICNPFTRDNHH